MISVNEDSRVVSVNRKEVEVTPKEIDLLLVLVKAEGVIVSREHLQAIVWGQDVKTDSRTIDQHIARLRSKLGPEGRSYIRTVISKGYRIEPGKVSLHSQSKAPEMVIETVTRFFKNGKAHYSYRVVSPGEAKYKEGARVRVGI